MPTPSPASGRMPVIRARTPTPMLSALDCAADRAGQTRSACLRELVAEGLSRRGLWPPRVAEDE